MIRSHPLTLSFRSVIPSLRHLFTNYFIFQTFTCVVTVLSIGRWARKIESRGDPLTLEVDSLIRKVRHWHKL